MSLGFYNTAVAAEFGWVAGVLFQEVAYLVSRNYESGTNLNGGKAWMFRTQEEFHQRHPYFSARQIANAFRDLKDAGLVEIAALNQKGYDRTRWYTLGPAAGKYLDDQQHAEIADCNMQKLQVASVEKCVMEPAKIAGPIQEETEEEKNLLSVQFDLFWNAYPRKEGKKKAHKAFSKLAPSVWPLLIPAVEKHKQRPQWQNRQYIPLPATWLNGERWEDEVDDVGEPEAGDRVPDGFQLVEMADGRKEWRRCSETT
ncbi:MAG: hypothetical protein IJO37_02395 [Ruminiclostridium sp.]|nr:hypothetical protein [Ruminiclostridium sp.]